MNNVPFLVKICGITNEDDAQVAVDAGANALGFNFYVKSPRYLTPDRARQIVAAVSGSYIRVGVFVNAAPEEILPIAWHVPLDVVQLCGNWPTPVPKTLRIWRSQSPHQDLERGADAYLLDTPDPGFGGSGRTFDWVLARGRSGRIIVAGGLDPDNVAEAIQAAQPWGVDACSRLESSPGKKDPQRVRDFVRAALLASRALPQLTL